ncbi:MAG TPA: DUF5615 family PIN-like protein [Pyrinomonadaceae bacterium]|nr:DUF5615 family PIN-like protein [Pyrinomonadaceae bacterium]
MSDSQFIRLYLDEDVSVLVAAMIRARGFDVLTTVEAGNRGASDEEQLEFASGDGRVLLTHNRVDFERLIVGRFDSGVDHSGLMIAVRRTPAEIVARLLRLLSEMTEKEMANQVRYL